MLLALKCKQLPLSVFITYTHQETLSLLMESGWDHTNWTCGWYRIKYNSVLLYNTFPYGDQNAFQKELFHRERELGVGASLISQMRKQEAWKGCHLLKVIQWIRFSAQETNRDLTLQRIPKGCKRTGKRSLLEAILEAQIFSTSWASGDKKSRVSCDGWLVVLPRISSPRRVSQPLPASWRALTWQTQFPGLFSRCLHCQVI